jgi:hypothetical protein
MDFFTRLSLSTLSLLVVLAAPGCLIDNKIADNPNVGSTGDDDPSTGTDSAGTTSATTSGTTSGGTDEPGDPSATDTSTTTANPTEPDQTTGATEVEPCIEIETVHAPAEQTPGGFSAEEVLAGKLGPRASTLQFADEPVVLSDQWKSKAFPVTVELRYEGGQVRWIDSEPNPDYVDEGLGPEVTCDDRMLVDVEIDFVTEAGEFDEHRAATLTASTVEFASLEVELTPEVMGTFDHTTLYSDPEWVSESVTLHASWQGALAGGGLSNLVKVKDFVGFGGIAGWGDEIVPDEGP